MGIPIGKLSLYSAFGGIDPGRTLPVMLDVGTNNDERLEDSCYLGARNPRLGAEDYDEFVDQFVDEVKRRWPNVLLQWEDFAQENATRILERYRNNILSFNDDIQGTAAVSLAVVTAAIRQLDGDLGDQRICILGAGSAGSGIAAMISAALVKSGVADPREQLVMVDSEGVVHDGRSGLADFQVPLAFSAEVANEWVADEGESPLETTVRYFEPTVLIGVSGVPSLFTERAIKEMAAHTPNPIILPLSNPTSRSEATPEDLLTWTNGKAIVATGSPFDPVTIDGVTHTISQSNNVYVFPGVGLGALASNATAVTNEMLLAAAEAVSSSDTPTEIGSGVLPPLVDVPEVSNRIARAVARMGAEQGVADQLSDAELDERIAAQRWSAEYQDFTSAGE